jgi:hypothetical protein
MTTASREEEDWESLASSSDSDEDDDITSMLLLTAAAAVAAVVSTICIAETSRSRSYDYDRSEWKVPKFIECKPNINDKVAAADLPEKASDMEKFGPLGTTTSLSSLSSNARATNHRATKRSSSEVLTKAIRDINSCVMQAQMQANMQKLESRRKYEEIRHKHEEIRRKRLKTDEEPAAIEELGMMNK